MWIQMCMAAEHRESVQTSPGFVSVVQNTAFPSFKKQKPMYKQQFFEQYVG